MPYTRPDVVSGVTRVTKPFVENILDGIDEKLDEATANATYARPVRWTDGNTFRVQNRGSAYAIGFDEVAGLGYFATTGLYSSTNNTSLTTLTLPPNVSSGADVGKVVRFGANVYCIAKDSSGFVKVFRSAPAAPDVSWTAVHTTAGNDKIGPAFNKSTWATGTNYLFHVEYGDPSGGPKGYRSADGTTWETILTQDSGLRHYHAIAADPYNPGHVYATAGDGDSKCVLRSTAGGAAGTWSVLVSDDNFQAVQISFSEDWVWFAGDSARMTVFVIDRNEPTVPMIASTNLHSLTPVPGAPGGRGLYTDGVLTSGSKTLTSATAAFTSADKGRMLRFVNVSASVTQQDGVFIETVNSATSVDLNRTAGGSQTGRNFYVDGDSFYRSAFYGTVDPATGIYYCISNDATSGGNRSGLFALSHVGGRMELLESYSTQTPGELFIWNGKIWCHQGIHPLTNWT